MASLRLRFQVSALAMFAGIFFLGFHAMAAEPLPARHVLGINWLPGFCETQPKRAECLSQSAARPDATQFSLHGLWPMRRTYCGIDAKLREADRKGDWQSLPAVALSPELASRLAVAMPGTVSGFDRHLWVRSGSCQTLSASDYFTAQLALLDAVNASAVQRLFKARIGGTVNEVEIKAAFDESFGAGAGKRVRMSCRTVGSRMVVTGLTIGLDGEIGLAPDMALLIKAAPPTTFKCASGDVDAAGVVGSKG